jgi:hypothetical protein
VGFDQSQFIEEQYLPDRIRKKRREFNATDGDVG